MGESIKLSQEIQELENEISNLGVSVERGICSETGEKIPDEDWVQALRELRSSLRNKMLIATQNKHH